MKSILCIIFCGLTFIATAQNNQEFVCLPCGYACDLEVHREPGTCSSCRMKLVEKSSIKFPTITVDELCNRITTNSGAIILDVRTYSEFDGSIRDRPSFGHFKHAININVEELPARLNELSKYKEREILVYCSHNHRSPRASYLLSTNGFKNVKNIAGGVSTFTQENNECLKQSFVFHEH